VIYRKKVESLGYISLTECVGVSSTTWPPPNRYWILLNHANYTAITPFKVIDFGTNRKPIRDFVLVINTNLPPILHRYEVMADYMLNFR